MAADIDALVSLVRAPAFVLCDPDGWLRPGGPAGVYVDDRRVLSGLLVQVDGQEPSYAGHELAGADTAVFTATLPGLEVRLTRTVLPDGTADRLELRAVGAAPDAEPRTVRVSVDMVVDETEISVVRAGGPGCAHRHGTLDTEVTLLPDRPAVLGLVARVARAAPGVVVAPRPEPPWQDLRVAPDDSALSRLVARSVADLDALRLGDAASPTDEFFAAGSPWYLTLFGRDSLWAARMTLPLGTEMAAGTLRTLARRQGTRSDPSAAEEPGKILHELRHAAAAHPDGGIGSTAMLLPAQYYGTVDATALWVLLLHDAWLWGLDRDVVEALLPALESALAWHRRALQGHGVLTYHDESGHGLANQGWKDSPEAVRFPDGRVAKGPIALAEAQAYAHEAAVAGARLLQAFGRPGAEELLAVAERLRRRFRDRFWVDDEAGPFPAIALDGTGRPVPTVTSNIGHLLGTGLLADEEERVAARRLVELSSGYGLRTMSHLSAGYDPLSYHCGSVWTHDTAIAVCGLARTGASPEALTSLVDGLLAAAPLFGFSMPELYGGQSAADGPPVPYPASCRPQAWAAAAGVAVATALAGIHPDVPAGTLELRPPVHASAAVPFDLLGVRVGGSVLDVSVRPGPDGPNARLGPARR